MLTEIDVAATLRAKLGVERPPLKILGAGNPDFANRALMGDPAFHDLAEEAAGQLRSVIEAVATP